MPPPRQPNTPPCCEWTILQSGHLPLRPDGAYQPVEHRATIPLIWPAGQPPAAASALLVDPCFTRSGYDEAAPVLARLGLSLDQIGWYFVTHDHFDHTLLLPRSAPGFTARPFQPGKAGLLEGVQAVSLPGHADDLQAVVFTGADGRQVWVAGDAILNEEWLRAWAFYWPNNYQAAEVAETWRSVARVVALADVIVPGHGQPIPVTAALAADLLEAYPQARYASHCPEVGGILQRRLDALRAAG
jgi:glyoxylase-like metal-dependent hydrolase (beta-lactamase superfamily II)